MSLKERPRHWGEVVDEERVSASEFLSLLGERDDALGATEVARRHYWIAEMTAREGLPVDWHHVAVRMAQALAGLPEGEEP